MFKRIILLALIVGASFAASPFFETSVYVVTKKANFRQSPTTSSKIAIEAEYNSAYKYISKIKGEYRSWYKVEYYDVNDYEVWYKPRTKDSISGINFQKLLTLYKTESKDSEAVQLLATKRNVKYDNKKANSKSWVRIRVHKPKVAYVASSLCYHINRPYFLVELALNSIAKYTKWSSNTRYNVLHGKIKMGMYPSMIEAIKGQPDYVTKDKTGRNLYQTYWYGSQAVNFRYSRVTSW